MLYNIVMDWKKCSEVHDSSGTLRILEQKQMLKGKKVEFPIDDGVKLAMHLTSQYSSHGEYTGNRSFT